MRSAAEVVKWLRLLRHDPWYRMPANHIPIPALARISGVGTWALFKIMETERISARSTEALGAVIDAIDAGTLVFYNGEPWHLPPDHAPRFMVAILCPESVWSLGSRCQACGGKRFLPVSCGGASWVACYNCMPPEQWPAIGAVVRPVELIAQELRVVYG